MTNGEKLKEIFPNIDNRLDAKTGIMIVKWADNTTKFFKTSWWNAEYKEPAAKNALAADKDKLALLEKTYDDFCNCDGGAAWLKIDGKEYSTDATYAIEGVNIFMEVFKQRLAKSKVKK